MRFPCFRHLSWRDEEGFSSCSICPCHRAVPTTPPECHVASVSPRHAMLPSPRSRGLGLRIFILFRGHLWVYFRYGPVTRSPSLRWLCRSASSASLFSADTTQAKGRLTFAPVGLPPTEHVCFFWTHCFAKIPCALKIVRFPATMAASSRSSLHPRTPRICPGEPERYTCIYKDGGTRTFSRRYVGSD
jgi:hypothetical protein